MLGVVGIGTVKFGRDSGVKYPGAVRMPSDDEASALLDAAEALGINLLDTAPAYGTSEERVGRLLRGRSHPWFISTKAGEEWDGATSRFDFAEAAIEKSIARSCDRLGVARLGCVLLHSDGIAEKTVEGFAGAVHALTRAKASGRVQAIGASVKSVEGAIRALEWAEVLMLEFGADQAMEAVAKLAAERGVGILAKKVLASGHLERLGSDPIRSALKRTLALPGVCSIVVGTTNIGHLQENCEAAAWAADELAMDKSDTEKDA